VGCGGVYGDVIWRVDICRDTVLCDSVCCVMLRRDVA
jgi:hypothetical protein